MSDNNLCAIFCICVAVFLISVVFSFTFYNISTYKINELNILKDNK